MAVPTVWSGAPESWSPVPAPGALRERDGSGPGAPRSQLGDQLKSQQAFTEYWGPDIGWFGTLTTLEPGQGYTLKAACAADGSCGNPRWVDVA